MDGVRRFVLSTVIVLLAGTSASHAGELDAYQALVRSNGPALLAWTRASIERAFSDSAAAPPDSLPDWPAEPTGLYLSLVGHSGTRACVGSTTPVAGTLAACLARSAADVIASDRRRPPLRRAELQSLRLVVTFAGRTEPVADPMQVRLAREGLLIQTANGAVAYVPGESRTVSWALADARRHGLLQKRADATFQRFDVVTLREFHSPEEIADASR
jgi:hypothetical protein